MVPTTFEIVGVHTQFVWFGPVGASEKRFLCRFGIAPRPYDRSFLSVFRRAAKPNPNPKAPISKPVWKCPKQGGGGARRGVTVFDSYCPLLHVSVRQ